MDNLKCDRKRLMELARAEVRKYPSMRLGQALFNVATRELGEKVDTLAGNRVDCFNDDSKVPLFLKALEELL